MKSWLRSAGIGLAVALLSTLGDQLWWDRHPGAKTVFFSRLLWCMLGGLVALFVVAMIRFYVREYRGVWGKVSEEERHGLQR